MKIFIAVILCKFIYFVGKKFGRGSSLPGKVVLKLFPGILKSVHMPKTVIAVSGSNGKTTTVEMIADILVDNGIKVIWNKEGSNQIEGVTTFLLSNCDTKGKVAADVVLIESDERYARLTFSNFAPTHFVITNLFRDQMTRNAHSEWIYDILKDAIKPETTLVLNGDDPLVSCFALDCKYKDVVFFSVDENSYSTSEPVGVYNDGKYCPHCKEPLTYEYFNFAHIGKYFCPNCGLHTNEALAKITSFDLDERKAVFDGENEIYFELASISNLYNLLAAYTLAAELGLDRKRIAASLNRYVAKNGRVQDFKIGEHNCRLLTSKHENSVSYNQSIDCVCRYKEPSKVMFLVDAISRKYYTSETSWLFDINFEQLRNSNVNEIILSGKYAYDLAVRFEFAELNINTTVEPDIETAIDCIAEVGNEQVFFITCFSDRDKILIYKDEQA